jgi:hypothetical protein
MSLYIDHDPLHRFDLPNYVRLFRYIKDIEDVRVFKEINN